jgi:hypothetical protein
MFLTSGRIKLKHITVRLHPAQLTGSKRAFKSGSECGKSVPSFPVVPMIITLDIFKGVPWDKGDC